MSRKVYVLMHSNGDRYETNPIKIAAIYNDKSSAENALHAHGEEVSNCGVVQIISHGGCVVDCYWIEEHDVI